MGHFLESNGIHVRETSTVSDSKTSIEQALIRGITHSDFIFITGGLGPTKDDITKKTLTDFFGDQLVMNQEVLQSIYQFFSARNRVVNEYTREQALVPSKCKVIPNHKGTAPGMWFEYQGKIIVSMPGVPYEMKDMMKRVIMWLKEQFNLIEIVHKTVYVRGIIESHLAEMISDWEDQLPSEIKLAYLPSTSCLMLRFTARGSDRNYLEAIIHQNIDSLKLVIGDYYSTYQKQLSEEVVGEILKEKVATISTAESCTGGNIAKMLTSVKGSSNYFLGSIIAYSTKIKEQVLKVNPKIIQKYGVVSEEVVAELALCAQKLFNSDYSIATSGLASEEDVDGIKGGTICIAIATPKSVYSKTILLSSNRQENIIRASNQALNFLIKLTAN
jgi:nicotinamide-nucleotide amidase